MTPRRSSLLLPALLTGLLLTGCGTAVVGGSAVPAGSQGPPEVPAGSDRSQSGTGAMDVCAFFDAAEVERLIGSAPEGRASSGGDGGACTWEDTTNYYSLTVDVGSTDTAINGTLPPWEPALGPERTLPNDMRDVNGAVEFVCGGNRLCSVQVVTEDLGGESDVAAGVDLVPVIRDKVGG